MKTTHVPNESFEHTKTFEYGNGASTEAPRTRCAVFNIVDRQPQEVVPAKVRCISDLVADNERDAVRAMLLAEARTELSEELLLDGASTLRTMRLQKGLSQTKLAAMLGTSQSHVARIERGTENVSIQTCRKLREALGVDMNALNEALLRQEAAYDKRASQR